MKVQLIVVQGKPEGKMIPLVGPSFRIGRGETCQLRPNSEQVSREHAEFQISGGRVIVRDLGSRNGTIVNGKALTEPVTLKDSDLIQIGPLTFAISIEGGPAPAAAAPPRPPTKPSSLDEVSHDEIESWLIADKDSPSPERPSGIYGGETRTMKTYGGATPSGPAASDPSGQEEEAPVEDEAPADEEEDAGTAEEMPEELIDESNPFYAAKKKPEAPAKPAAKDTSDAASDILRRLMERRRSH